MLKKSSFLVLILFVFVGCDFNSPTNFTEKAMNDSFFDVNNKSIELKEILNNHKEQKILINVWASWCRDCVVGFPNLKEFQKNNPAVKYVFLSTNRSVFSWKKAIKKYDIKGEH